MKIIAAVGLNNSEPEKIRKIILSGADIIRYSFVCGEIKENIKNIRSGMDIISELNSSTKIMVNIPSNKLRIGKMTNPVMVKEGDEIIVLSSNANNILTEQENNHITIETDDIGDKVNLHQIITVDHGKIALQVSKIINSTAISTKVLNNGKIQTAHTFNTTERPDKEKYIKLLEKIIQALEKIEIDYLSIPYIDQNTNEEILSMLSKFDPSTKIMLRIEDKSGIDNIEKICKEQKYYFVSFNRGELGDCMPYEKLGILQKEITLACKKIGKKIIISSQILEGAIDNYIPLRSDILDLTNMVIDGIDGILLTNETALSARPAYTITIAKKIISESKKYLGSSHK